MITYSFKGFRYLLLPDNRNNDPGSRYPAIPADIAPCCTQVSLSNV